MPERLAQMVEEVIKSISSLESVSDPEPTNEREVGSLRVPKPSEYSNESHSPLPKRSPVIYLGNHVLEKWTAQE